MTPPHFLGVNAIEFHDFDTEKTTPLVEKTGP